MNRRLFNKLGLVAAGLVIAVLALNWFGPQTAAASSRGKLLPTLATERAAVDRIRLSTNGSVQVELKRAGEHWTVVNRDGYPANSAKIRALLDSLSQAEKVEAKTADPAQYEKLGVGIASDKSLLLTLAAGDRTISELVVGTAVPRPSGQFVRLSSDKQSWLIDRELGISKDVSDWLNAELVNLPSIKIKRVERLKAQNVQCIAAPCLPVPGEPLFSLTKDNAEDSVFTLAPIPAGKQAGAAWLLAGLGDALNGLTAVNVIKQSAFDFTDVKTTITRYTGFDDLVVRLHHYLKGSRHYVSLVAEAGPAATDVVKQTVDALNQRHAGWLYEVSSYKGEGMARELTALVQDKPSGN